MMNRFEFHSIRSIRFMVNSDSVLCSVWVFCHIGSIHVQVGSVSGRFNFEFRVEIGSTLLVISSGLVSGRSVRVNWIGSGLPSLILHVIFLRPLRRF